MTDEPEAKEMCPCCHGTGRMECLHGCHESDCDVCGGDGVEYPSVAAKRMTL